MGLFDTRFESKRQNGTSLSAVLYNEKIANRVYHRWTAEVELALGTNLVESEHFFHYDPNNQIISSPSHF